MFVRNHPPVICPLAAHGRAYPVSDLAPVFQGSACSVKHMCDRDLPARQNMQVPNFHADRALPSIKPPQEITPDCSRSGVLERGDNVKIDNVGSIQWHELINVLYPNGLGPTV